MAFPVTTIWLAIGISFSNLVKIYHSTVEWNSFTFRRLTKGKQYVTIVLRKLALVVKINAGLGTVVGNGILISSKRQMLRFVNFEKVRKFVLSPMKERQAK
uniref:DUF304 domain-containing protein n=1 Tax=Romanomermis culicivorax TaxID=13658 RepID=A0A915HZY8_ROMCU